MSRTEQEAEFFEKIVKAYRANKRAPVPPTVIDPAKYDLRKASPATRAFLHAAHAMSGASLIEKAAAKADVLALLTILEETTQSRSVAERCAKAKAVLS
jgi:hypothetical protein